MLLSYHPRESTSGTNSEGSTSGRAPLGSARKRSMCRLISFVDEEFTSLHQQRDHASIHGSNNFWGISMGLLYQKRDWEVVDYEGYFLLPHFYARGPRPLRLIPYQYFACIGAAQTFGCFCTQPYPALLQAKIGLPSLNLGRAGAGPHFFVNHLPLLQKVNEARFVIVQVMSGRSEDNSLFESGGLEWLTRRSDGEQLGAELAYRQLLDNYSPQYVNEVIAETRANWIASYQRLLLEIKRPKVLFWFSQRGPRYTEALTSVHSLFGRFPQLVNAAMIESIKPFCDRYIECVSNRGMPQTLRSRFTGAPTVVDYARKNEAPRGSQINSYYPSPEMQADAAESLLGACRDLAGPLG